MVSILVNNDGVSLHVALEGEGPTVLLLHGWPDTGSMWRETAADLVAAGYRVAVPDLRGCGRSDKPRDVELYQMPYLMTDVAAIIGALEVERVTLVGHDWGAALAWAVAAFAPQLVERLVVISVGHPTSFRGAGLDQQLKSWYFLLFSYEGLGEAFLRKNNYEAVHRWLRHPQGDEVIAELERDGQISTHLFWYRANLPPSAFVDDPPTLPDVTVPVLALWSSGDLALGEAQMTGSAEYCTNGFTYVRFDGHSHWLPHEAPHEVATAIENFLRGVSREAESPLD